MVGNAGAAAQTMALHDALRTVCLTSDWTYSVFWTIRRRPRARGGIGGVNEDGSLMMMWEDGFCNEDRVQKAFGKMSIQLYNYGEGLMGKVASDKCHKWILKEPTDSEATNVSGSQWQSSFDALPPEWTDQFESGIKTIVVIQAGHGLLQLGSNKIIPEDLHFVLRMRHTFESLGFQSGFYPSHLFSPIKQPTVFDWGLRPSPSAIAAPNFHTMGPQFEIPPSKGKNISILIPPPGMHNTTGGQDNDIIKWPDGLSSFLGNQTGPNLNPSSSHEMTISPSPTSLDRHGHDSDEGLIYADVMEG